jgi:phthiocerol/phenolphthiocerol synthesis type-I polyketide synthase A
VAAVLAGTTRWGSFLDDIDAFDAEFFEISPREADRLDPQQRLLLEVAWEALEHAGIPASNLRRSATGVFTGACVNDYGFLALRDLDQIDAWSNTGAAVSIISNRLSYFLDLRGPSLAVDTACSSSLVAVHLACQNLRLKECDLALAAGVNLLLSPAIFRSFDKAQALSPTGQCHAFDAAADGFVRGEGCGVVVLKRLSDAVHDGDRVLAVVRGSAVNQDGRSNGLMAPNPAAQMAVLRAAYANAGIPPFDVDYVEAHGTGTLLGDPIEARALGTVLGRGRAENSPLLIGAVKTNLGHLEAAAGIVGFIKTVLAVQRRHIPPNRGFQAPNPHIQFNEMRMKVVAELQDWPVVGRARRAGVSSFGFGGTNAHVVVEQGPDPTESAVAADESACTLVVSGKSVARMGSWAGRLADWMDGDGAAVALADVAHTVNHHRGRHAVFGTVCARDRSAAVAGLRALAAGQSGPGVVAPHEGACGPGRVFVFSGQGSQWVGMGQQLLADEPAFAAAVAELEPDFVQHVGFSLQQVLAGGLAVSGIETIQPVLVGMQLALTELWRAYGVEPDAVVGHSMGEVAAAVVAGALSAADGLRVIATRSRLMARLSGRGAMALLELDAAAAEAAVADFADVGVAVYTSPRQTVIAGPPDQVDAVMAVVAGQDRLARRVDVDVASHHQIIDPILPQLRSILADLAPGVPAIPMFSTTDDHLSGLLTFDAGYWVDNLRRPVRFSDAITAAAENHCTFIEISPHPLLTQAISETVGAAHHHAIATLQRDTDDTVTFHTNLNSTCTTHPPDTDHPPEPFPALPTTPWHHTHHWITTATTPALGSASKAGTLLGQRITVSSTRPTHLWQARLVPEAKPYPGYHRVHGVEVVPASILLQTLLEAAAGLGVHALSDVRFQHPVVVDRAKVIQVVADDESVRIASSSAADTPADRWTTHVTARLSPVASFPGAVWPAENGSRRQMIDNDTSSIADTLRQRGVEGQPFPWTLASCRQASDGLVARVDADSESVAALLDAAFCVAPLAGAIDSQLYVPAGVAHVQAGVPLTGRCGRVSVRHTGSGADEVTVDVIIGDDSEPAIFLSGLRYEALDPGTAMPDADPTRFAHEISWQPWQRDADALNPADGPMTIAIVGGQPSVADDLRKRLTEAGHVPAELAHARYVLYVASQPADHANADVDYAVRVSAEITDLVRLLAERSERDPVTLWILTAGVREAAEPVAVRQGFLWGLAGVIAAEHREVWGGLIDVAAAADAGDTVRALADVLGTSGKAVLALRDGVFHARELVPVTRAPLRGGLRCRPDAAYLITGGLGTLGLLTAGWLAERGARRLVLAGRTPLPPRRDWDADNGDIQTRRRVIAIQDLERRGVAVEAVTVDIGSPDDVQALLARRDRDGAPPIRGVVHAAGVTGDQLVTATTEESLRKVMWPKIAGAQALNAAFPIGSLDFLFFMSSAATVFGIPGQGSYAAANSYLDALARARHGQGCHSVSLDWAAWQGLGFAADAQLVTEELHRLGARALTPDEAFTAWDHVHRHGIAQAIIVPLHLQDESRPSSGCQPTRVDTWRQMSAADVETELTDTIRALVAQELRTPESKLEVDRPFVELGLNSMMALSIRREIEQLGGLELSATMLWNHPTIAELAAYLTKKLLAHHEKPADNIDETPGPTGSALDALFDRVESTATTGTETRAS